MIDLVPWRGGLAPSQFSTLAMDALASTIFFWVGFHLVKTPKMNSRRVAWIVSFLCSVTCSTLSLEYLFKIYQNRFDTSTIIYKDDRLSRFLCVFFMTYLVLDLVIGVKFYRREIDPLSGWGHHIVYIIINLWALREHFTVAGSSMMIIEIPTAILAVGRIWPAFRYDKLFAFSFFATRILYFALLVASVYINERDGKAKVRLFPIGLPLLFLHILWFHTWIQQQRKVIQGKKGGAGRKSKAAAAHS